MSNTPYPKVHDIRGWRPGATRPFQAYWWDPVAKCKGDSGMFETAYEAHIWVTTMEREALAAYRNAGLTESTQRKVGFREYAEIWFAHLANTKVNTINSKRSSMNVLSRIFGDRSIGSITTMDVARLKADLSARVSAGTVKIRLTHLNEIFETAVADETVVCPGNPVAAISRPKVPACGNQGRVPTHAELSQIMRHLQPRYRAPVALAYATGLRIGEICGLRRDDIDLDAGWVTVNGQRHNDDSESDHTKRGVRGVRFPIPSASLPHMRDLMEHCPPVPSTGHAFSMIRKNGTLAPLSQSRVRDHFKRACEKAGLPHKEMRFHGLRHACVISYVQAGADPYVTKRAAGHGDIRTTMAYYPDPWEDDLVRFAGARPALDQLPDAA